MVVVVVIVVLLDGVGYLVTSLVRSPKTFLALSAHATSLDEEKREGERQKREDVVHLL